MKGLACRRPHDQVLGRSKAMAFRAGQGDEKGHTEYISLHRTHHSLATPGSCLALTTPGSSLP